MKTNQEKKDLYSHNPEVAHEPTFEANIPAIVEELVSSCKDRDSFDHVDPTPFPSREKVVRIILQTRRILFPGYFGHARVDPVNLSYVLGREVTELFHSLARQVVLAFQHSCLQYERACLECIRQGQEVAYHFIRMLPNLRRILATDTRAALSGDPAAKSFDEVIFSYPGLFAITVYRMAHLLYETGIPLLPRMMTEYAHSLTGIDIHPGARIGERFFIDHGTGVVIGETTEIGDRVRLYQGVTLGALSIPRDKVELFRDKKRHPTIGDDVIIYSNATILGPDAVIGARSVIGGNVWITGPVPPDTKVILKKPELIYIGRNHQTKEQRRRP
ncbi:MAG: serine acetyltransferase [Deltaproteobacteria bacterium]|nr:serine acetyltransferase [Deltaproteobacteria bacterium]HDM09743.1 serine acetyltransferase [Desulfobacteraceae bacterium]